MILTTSWDNTARIWDFVTGQPISQAMRHDGKVLAGAFSQDGKFVLTASEDNTARLWESATGKSVGRAMVHANAVQAVAFSADGRFIFTGSKDNTARLWAAKSCEPIGQPVVHGGEVTVVAFTPDGETAISGASDGTTRLLGTRSERSPEMVLKHEGRIRWLSVSRDGRTLLTVCDGKFEGIWDLPTGTGKFVRQWHLPTGKDLGRLTYSAPVTCAAFSPDSKILAIASQDNYVRLWDSVDHKDSSKDAFVFTQPIQVLFSEDGSYFMTIGHYAAESGGKGAYYIALFRTKRDFPATSMTLGKNGACIAIAPSFNAVAIGTAEGDALVWRNTSEWRADFPH